MQLIPRLFVKFAQGYPFVFFHCLNCSIGSIAISIVAGAVYNKYSKIFRSKLDHQKVKSDVQTASDSNSQIDSDNGYASDTSNGYDSDSSYSYDFNKRQATPSVSRSRLFKQNNTGDNKKKELSYESSNQYICP